MKSKLITLAALSLAACAPNPGTVTLYSFSPISAKCGSSDPGENSAAPGVLDIANGQAPNRVEYWIQVNLKLNTLTSGLSTSSGQLLEEPNRENFVMDKMHLTYTLRKGSGAPKLLPVSDDIAITAVVKPGSKVFIPANIIGPKGSEALFKEIDPSTAGSPAAADTAELKVGVEVMGHLSGTNVPVTTGKNEFAIEVFMSNNCPNGYASVLFFCPFPGQDGTKPVCK